MKSRPRSDRSGHTARGVMLAARQIAWRCAWSPVLVLVAHLVADVLLDAYALFPALDVPMHLAGGCAIAYFAWHALDVLEQQRLLDPSGGALRSLLVFGMASTAAVLWEFGEFVSDELLGTRLLSGLNDTLSDMLFGMVGACAYLVLRASRSNRHARG